MLENSFMARALMLASAATEQQGEVPIAALVVAADGTIIAEATNRIEQDNDPLAHAEILALRAAQAIFTNQSGIENKVQNKTKPSSEHHQPGRYLYHCDLYVTLEPCPMCAQACSLMRIRRLYFAAWNPISGAVDHGPRLFQYPGCRHHPEVYGGIAEHQASSLLRNFFHKRR